MSLGFCGGGNSAFFYLTLPASPFPRVSTDRSFGTEFVSRSSQEPARSELRTRFSAFESPRAIPYGQPEPAPSPAPSLRH
ncbi:hypothetical protein BDM02DRAFT_3113739 [Thelephora ganbajun]|uniref:Uncharacterized protein n=1 Tax=Thelephora ganbajun TaxID=370292 RepID=A0ACB6ZI99_THEGA|nr:hypothetical protein BDM02DRAFT_3113739 [Thelephora ganbajun]